MSRTESVASLSAPASKSSRTQSVWPFWAAQTSAVRWICVFAIYIRTFRKPLQIGISTKVDHARAVSVAVWKRYLQNLSMSKTKKLINREGLLKWSCQICEVFTWQIWHECSQFLNNVSGCRQAQTYQTQTSDDIAHLPFGLFVGTALKELAHTVEMTSLGGSNQRCFFILRMAYMFAVTGTPPARKQYKKYSQQPRYKTEKHCRIFRFGRNDEIRQIRETERSHHIVKYEAGSKISEKSSISAK